MLKNYLKIALRNLLKQKMYAIINIMGLAAGISSFLLIILFVQNELSYEKHIPDSERMYRLVEIQKPAGISPQHVAITSGPFAPALEAEIPEVEQALRLMPSYSIINVNNKVFQEPSLFFTEEEVIRFFNLQIIEGNAPEGGFLNGIGQALISESTAIKYFGRNQNVVGETIKEGDRIYMIDGVFEDLKKNSHIKPEVLLSFADAEQLIPELKTWGNNYLVTYILARKGIDKETIEEKIYQGSKQKMAEMGVPDQPVPEMYLQPFQDIHLKSKHIKFHISQSNGDIGTVRIFIIIALLILVVACINFINLSTARASKRSREVGIRKVVGATRNDLIIQFLGESLTITFFAMLIGASIVELFLPQFNILLNAGMEIDFIHNPLFNVGLLGILIIVGMAAGIYPAFYLSSFNPVSVLKTGSFSKPGGGGIRKVLVITQFVVATALIFCTSVIFHQLKFLKNKEIGYNPEQVISMNLYGKNSDETVKLFKSKLLENANIISVAASSNPNGVSGSQGPINVADTSDTQLMVRFGFVDPDYFPAMEVQILKGRNFSYDNKTDPYKSVIINESAARTLNWVNPIGKQFKSFYNDSISTHFTVIGLIKDYHYYSLHQVVEPAIYIMDPSQYHSIVVRYKNLDIQQVQEQISVVWDQFFPQYPFQSGSFNERIQRQYTAENHSMRIFTFFAILCVIVSCLGLYGLTAFVVEQKSKEIGIRKVLGSSSKQVIWLLVKDFLKMIGIAVIIASPFAFYYMYRWLANYPFHIGIAWYHFALACLTVLAIAFLTVFFHARRAAVANPVDTMKYE